MKSFFDVLKHVVYAFIFQTSIVKIYMSKYTNRKFVLTLLPFFLKETSYFRAKSVQSLFLNCLCWCWQLHLGEYHVLAKYILSFLLGSLKFCCSEINVVINISSAADSVLSFAGKYIASTEDFTVRGIQGDPELVRII